KSYTLGKPKASAPVSKATFQTQTSLRKHGNSFLGFDILTGSSSTMKLKPCFWRTSWLSSTRPSIILTLRMLKLSLTSRSQENPIQGYLPAAKCHANSNRLDHTLKGSQGRIFSA